MIVATLVVAGPRLGKARSAPQRVYLAGLAVLVDHDLRGGGQMTVPTGAPGDEVPEADWAEQAADAGPLADGEQPTPASSLAADEREADEADLVEQDFPVDYSDDEQ
jgi:hypothetical protein